MARPLVPAAMAAVVLYVAFTGIANAQGSFRSLLASHEDFPPRCKCDRARDHSPYGLSLIEPTADGNYFKFCFKVVTDTDCDPTAKCCDKELGVEKIEFHVDPQCKSSVKKVTINGVNDPGFEYNVADSVLRVTGIDTPGGASTEVCIFASSTGSCPTLESICGLPDGSCKYSVFNNNRKCCPVGFVGGAPPMPLGPNVQRPPTPAPILSPAAPPLAPWIPDFPYCKCEKSSESSSLTVAALPSTAEGNITQLCFVVSTEKECSLPDSPCCSFELYKMEFKANGACAKALLYSTINDGRPKPRFFQLSPYPVIKVTPMRIEGSADGTKVCLFVRTSTCSVDELFPGGITHVALFSWPGETPKCCPVTALQL